LERDKGEKLARHPKVVSRDLAEGKGTVLLHLDSAEYYWLNSIGALTWSLIDGETSPEQIAAEVSAQVESPPPEVSREVEDFLTGLRERNLVTG
jgi:hypothetical protein